MIGYILLLGIYWVVAIVFGATLLMKLVEKINRRRPGSRPGTRPHQEDSDEVW